MITADARPDPAALIHAGRDALACDRCGAQVLVAKNSLLHTSVQWTRQAERRCHEFAEAAAAGRDVARVAACTALRDSIERAVAEGRLAVPGTRRS